MKNWPAMLKDPQTLHYCRLFKASERPFLPLFHRPIPPDGYDGAAAQNGNAAPHVTACSDFVGPAFLSLRSAIRAHANAGGIRILEVAHEVRRYRRFVIFGILERHAWARRIAVWQSDRLLDL